MKRENRGWQFPVHWFRKWCLVFTLIFSSSEIPVVNRSIMSTSISYLNFVYNSNLQKAKEHIGICCIYEYGQYLMDGGGEGAERTAGQGRPLHLSGKGWPGHMLFASLHSLSPDLWCHPDWWAPPGHTAQWRRSIQTGAQPIHLEFLVESRVTVHLLWEWAALALIPHPD